MRIVFTIIFSAIVIGILFWIRPDTSAPPEVLAKLANDESDNIRQNVASNKSTPPEALVELASDEDLDVRRDVARNRSTPSDVLAQLVNDKDKYVRIGVALNQSTPLDILAQLANDEDEVVRRYVTYNKSTPPEVLVQFANDEDLIVRIHVAENLSTPPEVLTQLANDEDEYVREFARKNPNYPKQASRYSELLKFAQWWETEKQTSNTKDWYSIGRHQWAREILLKAFRKVMGREPSLSELQLVQATALGESSYGRGWKDDPKRCPNGNCSTSNNWGAIQCAECKPSGGKCPPGSFLYRDSYPTESGKNKVFYWCYKAYATPEEGAADLIKTIFLSGVKSNNGTTRGQGTLNAAENNSIIDYSSAMYDSKYYGGFGKTREERVAGHVQMINSNINTITNALGEKPGLVDAMPQDKVDKEALIHMISEKEKPKEKPIDQNIEQQYQGLMKELFAKGPLERLVRHAVERDVLPTTSVLLALRSDASFQMQVRYARILCSALRSELGAECSIHTNGKKIEIETDVVGTEKSVLKAVNAVASGITEAFELSTKRYSGNGRVVLANSFIGCTSSYKLLSSKIAEGCFRKFTFEIMG